MKPKRKLRLLTLFMIMALTLSMMPAAVFAESQIDFDPETKYKLIDADANKRTLKGEGTAENPYQISSADDLDKVRYYISETGEEDVSVEPNTEIKSKVIEGYFKLTNDIDMSVFSSWMPIGTTTENQNIRYKTAFVGTFDGNGKTISNLTLDTSYRGIGLFTRIGIGGTVKNLKMDNCKAGTEDSLSKQEVGAVCGTAKGATFSNIHLTNITILGEGQLTGGLSGDILNENQSTISNCSVTNSMISGGSPTGGMFGRIHTGNTVSNCKVFNTKVTSSGQYVGGLAGNLKSDCSNCAAENVTVTSNFNGTGSGYAGGLFGYSDANVESCFASGTVTANNGAVYGGGLVGSLSKDGVTMKNCSANVAVTATKYAGGLVGGVSANSIENCFATGNVTFTGNSLSTNYAVGGLIGNVEKCSSIKNCYATGTVSANGENLTAANTTGIGGLIGNTRYAAGTAVNIENCYATGDVQSSTGYVGGLIGYSQSDIKDSYASGSVSGTKEVGGFVGYIFDGEINNCYAEGSVSGTEDIGGFAGTLNTSDTNDAKIENAAASGAVSATSECVGGFIGHTNGTPQIKNAIAIGAVNGSKAGAFAGSVSAVTDGFENCYANSSNEVPFTASTSGYYYPQNCFYAGSVIGIIADSDNMPTDSSKGYYYAKMDFSKELTAAYGDSIVIEQTDFTANTSETPKHTLTVKSNPENLVNVADDGTITAGAIGSGTLSLVLTVNGKDFVFGTANLTISAKEVDITLSDKTVNYSGNAEKAEATSGDSNPLPTDLKLRYSYKFENADDSTYTHVPPSAPGTYIVKVESASDNYRFEPITATLTISDQGLTDMSDSAVITEPNSLVYDGTAKAFTASCAGIDQLNIVYYDSDGNVLNSAPTAAGDYTVTINGKNDSSFVSISKEFKIVNPSSSGGNYVPPTVQKPTVEAGSGAAVTLSTYGTIATITVESGYEITDVTLNGVSLGKKTVVTGLKTGDVLIVKTQKLSDEDAEYIDRLKAGVKATTIKLKSSLGKGFIKLNWTKSAGYKVDYYEVYKSTKRYSGYGTEPYWTTKTGGMKNSYKNTKELKKGTRYYYKVRGVRIIDGEKVYTEYSNKAWRTVK